MSRKAHALLAWGTLAAAYIAVEAFIIGGSVSPARDGARYMKYALRLGTEPWVEVFRTSDDHPGYPVLLAALFDAGIVSPPARVLAAQAVTSLAGLSFILLSFAVLRRLFGSAPAWAASFSLIFLPRPAWTFADVLSDPLHAAFWMASAWAFLGGLRSRRPAAFLLSGVLAGGAYWVRVDAIAIAASGLATLAVGSLATLAGGSFMAGTGARLDRRALASMAAHATGFGASLALFAAACGSISKKPVSQIFLLGSTLPPEDAGRFVAAALLPGVSTLLPAAWRVLEVLAQEVQGVHLVTAALGLAITARRRPSPEALFIATYVGLHFFALLVVSWKAGYFSGRYFLPLLPIILGLGMAGVSRLSLRAAEWRRAAGRRLPRRPDLFGLSLAVGVSLAVSLPSLVGRRLHENEHGAMRAGAWVAARASGADTVRDPYYFPTFLAGIGSRAVKEELPPRQEGRHYAIVEERDLPRFGDIARAAGEGRARIAAEFPRRRDGSGGLVRVYVFEP